MYTKLKYLSSKYDYILFLFLGLLIFSSCSQSPVIEDVKIVTRKEWSANTAKPFKSQIPSIITVHHEGTYFDTSKQTAKEHILNIQKWSMGKDKNWIDVPYHFLVGLDGAVFEGRDINTLGQSNTSEDVDGQIQIALLGNFEEQEPTKKQINALVNLIAMLCKQHKISPEMIKTHKDFSVTQCPGKNLLSFFTNGKIKEEVIKLLR